MSSQRKTEQEARPTVYVIAGPNGAGKTTFASQFLPDFVRCQEFLNADLIAAGLSPFAPETQNVRAGRLLLERFRELVSQKADFGFETTLSGRTYVKLLGNMKAHGYRVVLFFLWLPSAEMAIARVESRLKQGGTTFLLRPFGDDMRLVYEIYSVSITRNAMNYGC
jgi:predicted ABC-type ATPase